MASRLASARPQTPRPHASPRWPRPSSDTAHRPRRRDPRLAVRYTSIVSYLLILQPTCQLPALIFRARYLALPSFLRRCAILLPLPITFLYSSLFSRWAARIIRSAVRLSVQGVAFHVAYLCRSLLITYRMTFIFDMLTWQRLTICRIIGSIFAVSYMPIVMVTPPRFRQCHHPSAARLPCPRTRSISRRACDTPPRTHRIVGT